MNRQEIKSLKDSDAESLLEGFLSKADALSFTTSKKKIPILDWTKRITLGSRPFQIEGHEYEIDMLTCDATRQCYKKGAQMGVTEINVLKSMYGLIFSKYPQGCLYLFPTNLDVSDFSKGRFQTLIRDNPKEVGVFVSDTDAVSIKRVQKAMLYLRGARATSKIEGIKKSSSQLKGVPVDRLVYDEIDEMEPSMVDLARERLSHSEIKEEASLSTPSIPDYGIDKLYQVSDQRIWMIRCEHCGTETCLELEFPECLLETAKGVIRVCKKCRQEIFPRNGRWIPQYPERSKDLVGWWISQLNSLYVDPGAILKAFNDPPNGNITEVYNSKLGMAYVAAENRLSISDIYGCCGQDVMATKTTGPCAMGVDVGKLLHVVVGIKTRESLLELIYFARVSSFNDVHDIAKRFNVECAVVDLEPEMRKAREFQASEEYSVFLCDYQDRVVSGPQWDEENGMIKVNRTEICDTTHELFTKPGDLILPRRCDEVDRFAQQARNIAKVLEEDPETGSREYRYRKLGEDHFRHALNYCYLASTKVRVADSFYTRHEKERKSEIKFNVFGNDHDRRDNYP
jgi:hypothetical protein